MRSHEQVHQSNNEPDIDDLLQRVSDAWSWLVAHGLVGPHHRQDPASWYRVTSRGRAVLAAESVDAVLAENRLPEDLHVELQQSRTEFLSGRSELAVFAAMRQVEIRLREQSGAGNDVIGVVLARSALHPESGPLTDQRHERGERDAFAHLFAGALGAFKNPTSHRLVDFDEPAVASDIILLADLLLRLLDTRPGGSRYARLKNDDV